MNSLGNITQTIMFKGFNGNNLYEEFVTSAAVKEGQFVTLDAAGTIAPITTTTLAAAIIGVAMSDAILGAAVTIAMKGYGTCIMEGSVTMPAGPVKFASFTAATATRLGFNRVTAAVNAAVFVAAASAGSPTTALTQPDTKQIGWAIDGSTAAGDLIRVVISN